MDTKAWIELLVNILGNGVVIWGVQYVIMKRVEKRNNYSQIRNEVYQKNLVLIENGLASCRALTSAMVNSAEEEKITNMKECVENLREDFRKLYYFYEDYHAIIDADVRCKEKYSVVNARFVEAIQNWDNEDGDILLDFLKDSEDILHSIMDATLEHIYGVK